MTLAPCEQMYFALRELVAEFDAASERAASEQGCYGLTETAGIVLAREALAAYDDEIAAGIDEVAESCRA